MDRGVGTGSTSPGPTARAMVRASGSHVNITSRYAGAAVDMRPMRAVGGLRSSPNRWDYGRKLRCSGGVATAPSARSTVSEHCGEEPTPRHVSPRGCVGENCKWTANGRGWTRWDHGRLALPGVTSADSEDDIRRRIVTAPDVLTRPHNPKVGGSNPSPATRKLNLETPEKAPQLLRGLRNCKWICKWAVRTPSTGNP